MKIYSANGMSFNFAGISVDSGRGIDVFAKIEKITKEAFTTQVGIDGEVTRSQTHDERCKVTINVMQTSDMNDPLTAIHLLDLKAENGAGVGPLMLRDQNGRSVLIEPEAFIEGLPDQEFGKEAKDVGWVFICPSPERFVGGN